MAAWEVYPLTWSTGPEGSVAALHGNSSGYSWVDEGQCAWRRLYGFTKSVAWADTKFWGKLVVYVRYSTDFTDQENDGPFSSGLPGGC